MYKGVITRDLFFSQQASLGNLYLYDDCANQIFDCKTLERGWVNNENRISCLPDGIVKVVWEWSDKFERMLWEIKGVEPREECKFHVMNYWFEGNGCIGLGNNRKFIDGDAIMDITSSRDTMKKFHKALDGQTEFQLEIITLDPYVLNTKIL